MYFGDWLKQKREEAGLTQLELSRAVGCTSAYISHIERGYQRRTHSPGVGVDMVDNLARALNVPISEARLVAGYAPPQMEGDDSTRTLVSYFELLPRTYKDIVLLFVQALHREAAPTFASPQIDHPQTTMGIHHTAPVKNSEKHRNRKKA